MEDKDIAKQLWGMAVSHSNLTVEEKEILSVASRLIFQLIGYKDVYNLIIDALEDVTATEEGSFTGQICVDKINTLKEIRDMYRSLGGKSRLTASIVRKNAKPSGILAKLGVQTSTS